jgi:hypothetical protein
MIKSKNKQNEIKQKPQFEKFELFLNHSEANMTEYQNHTKTLKVRKIIG